MENLTLNNEICNQRSCLEVLAKRFTNDLEYADDLVQETLIKAIQYHKMYKQGTNLRGWLYTIMKNTFINGYRKAVKESAIIASSGDFYAFQLLRSAANNQGENKLMMEDINKALKVLKPEYSRPFLRYFEGYRYREIAEELGIPIGTVKTRIRLAKQVLQAQLKMYKGSFKAFV